jgi:NAD(P)-dependent dehydrogenase (short-subunit alcohol dehydrogenase family)
MSKYFTNKVVLVTGASQGLGRDIALSFAREGAKLVLAARSADRLDEVAEEVRELGSEAIAVRADVSDEASVENLVEKVMAAFGRVDVLVNNAGIGRVGAVESAAFETDVRETLQASLFGMVRVTQSVLPMMRKQRCGTIVNMSSVMGRKAFARFGSYAIVMHAVSAFSDALRQEVQGTGIRVSMIHPALTATRLLEQASPAEMPPPFRHMTPLSSEAVGLAVVKAVRRGTRRLVLPKIANTLLLGEAVSPWLGDFIAKALTVKSIAWLFGLSRGQTYREVIPSQNVLANAERSSL